MIKDLTRNGPSKHGTLAPIELKKFQIHFWKALEKSLILLLMSKKQKMQFRVEKRGISSAGNWQG